MDAKDSRELAATRCPIRHLDLLRPGRDNIRVWKHRPEHWHLSATRWGYSRSGLLTGVRKRHFRTPKR